MNEKERDKAYAAMLAEDGAAADLTTAFTPQRPATARIISRQEGILAGIEEVRALFVYGGIAVTPAAEDGTAITKNQTVLEAEGDNHTLLSYERTALNLIARMSGIATLTRRYAEAAKKANPDVTVAATRKTTPLFRAFEKRAVEIGGGHPHRFNLTDEILIKDNHLAFFPGVADAVTAARQRHPRQCIEIEVTSTEDALAAACAGADTLLLDNFTPKGIASTLAALNAHALRDAVVCEASGGITLENIQAYAATGVDVISVGALTHSAPALDFSMQVAPRP